MSTLPYIGELNGVSTLFVKDEPFFVLGGELHNSSSSNLLYMEEKVWPMLRGLNMNTVVLPVAWESVEPVEGVFDFSLVDGLLAQARREGMRLVVLWFGLWKNSESNYAPGWVKRDTDTYFRVCDASGKKLNIISPFCDAAVTKDAYAFGKLMEHLHQVDGEENTVIFVQIENEIGVLGADRDFSHEAEMIYEKPVPSDILAAFEKNNMQGNDWTAVFGEAAPEMFMAWGYARAVEQIAEAGKAFYQLPMYVNAWLEQHPWRPGTYPCGGPVMKMAKMWKACAPSLFTLAPDIYDPHTADVMDEYAGEGEPSGLFQKSVRTRCAPATCFMHSESIMPLVYPPLALKTLWRIRQALKKPPLFLLMELNIDISAMDGTKTAPYLSAAYDMMTQLRPLYMQYRNTPGLQAFVQREANDGGLWLRFSSYDFVVSYKRKEEGQPVGAGMIFELAPDKFLCVGMNYKFDRCVYKAGQQKRRHDRTGGGRPSGRRLLY